MKYCLDYFNKSEYEYEVDEIIIDADDTGKHYAEFIDSHPDQRIIIRICPDEDKLFAVVDELVELAKTHKFTILVDYHEVVEFVPKFEKEGIPCYNGYIYNHWEEFNMALNSSATDIRISGELAFSLNKVAAMAHEVGKKIRVIANNPYENNVLPIYKHFFIRPEDVEYYEPYVDVIEFSVGSLPKFDVLYKIYTKDKSWYGDLGELIYGLKDIDSRCVLPTFSIRRMTCGRRCIKGTKCTLCESTIELSRAMKDKGYTVKTN